MTFQTLGLSRGVLDALASKNYSKPTPIQRDAIPLILQGRDLLGIAQTGTGKTAAFMLPAIERLVLSSRGRQVPGRVRMLVLAPTRELAAQIADTARSYAANMRLSIGVIFGGTSNHRSVREVARGLDVLVATPGRLLDLVDQNALDLSALEILVLDEADQMLDLGFIHALKAIVKIIPSKRQTLFFSATMPKSIRQLADAYLRSPAQVAVAPVATTCEKVEQRVIFVNQSEKLALLTVFLKTTPIDRALVFSRTKHGADRIVRFLMAAGVEANAIHGNKSQGQRERALELFRSGRVPVLVATDIAARGIDIPGVSHVLNFDLPNVPEQYVHRIGRTARAGATGMAIAFCSAVERAHLRDIERLTRQKIDALSLPDGFGASVEALKRLKPEPLKQSQKPARSPTKADRRVEGQRRQHRNEREQRHPHRAEGHPARNEREQRHPHRAEGHPAHRPEPGRPKRPFGGRRGRPAAGRFHSGVQKG
jgi:ATP-dependent RNA helicase RhlE